jgi:hypothetical protein
MGRKERQPVAANKYFQERARQKKQERENRRFGRRVENARQAKIAALEERIAILEKNQSGFLNFGSESKELKQLKEVLHQLQNDTGGLGGTTYAEGLVEEEGTCRGCRGFGSGGEEGRGMFSSGGEEQGGTIGFRWITLLQAVALTEFVRWADNRLGLKESYDQYNNRQERNAHRLDLEQDNRAMSRLYLSPKDLKTAKSLLIAALPFRKPEQQRPVRQPPQPLPGEAG